MLPVSEVAVELNNPSFSSEPEISSRPSALYRNIVVIIAVLVLVSAASVTTHIAVVVDRQLVFNQPFQVPFQAEKQMMQPKKNSNIFFVLKMNEMDT